MSRKLKRGLVISLAGIYFSTFAQDRADMDRTQIIGNRELPKVLYIVPWKKPVPGDLVGRPPVSVLDEAMAPLDRDVFRRQVTYDSQTRDKAAAPGTAPKTAPATTSATQAPPVTPQKSNQ